MLGQQQYIGSSLNNLWNPSYIDTSLWLDGSDTSTITLNGSNVSQWNDKSGNDNHATQPTATRQPLYGDTFINSKNTLACDSDFMELTNTISTMKSAFFITTDMVGSVAFSNVAPIIGNIGSPEDHTLLATKSLTPTISIDGSIGNSGHASANGGELVAGTNIDLGLSLLERASDLMLYADYNNAASTKTVMSLLDNSFMLIGTIGEIILLDSVPVDDDRQIVEGYLAWKWGIVDLLPLSHLYKNSPPMVWE